MVSCTAMGTTTAPAVDSTASNRVRPRPCPTKFGAQLQRTSVRQAPSGSADRKSLPVAHAWLGSRGIVGVVKALSFT